MAQNQTVLHHLKTKGGITDIEAYNDYGIRRLAARINDLKEQGNEIETHMIKGTNRDKKLVRFARYILKSN